MELYEEGRAFEQPVQVFVGEEIDRTNGGNGRQVRNKSMDRPALALVAVIGKAA